ncbi:hypothetical protein BSKO_00885 [Bryopsis sp. KO-2023]|nr:hypothetical protein BSKO_00885 [Bryopsis sp. KO-2023]
MAEPNGNGEGALKKKIGGFISTVRGIGNGGPGEKKKKFSRQSTYPIHMAVESARRMALHQAEPVSPPPEEPGVTPPPVAPPDEIQQPRVVHLNGREVEPLKAANNSIKTSKYNPLTFIFYFLFEMFSRVAYLYFLAQAALSWWEVVSPFSGVGATMALSFVLVVSAVKAAAEDIKRHVEDGKTNNSIATVVDPHTGETKQVKWKEVKVGDVIKVKDDELFPADILCLQTGLSDNVCFIRTTNLDGESNLKIRKPVDIKLIPGMENELDPTQSPDFKFTRSACVECEQPNGNLHKFRGRFIVDHVEGTGGSSHKQIPVSMSEMLLRGTILKNSKHVYGLVVYTGKESRIQMNAASAPLKMGSFDRFLNIQITLLIIAQILLCLLLAIGNVVWRELEGDKRYFLAFDVFVEGNIENNGTYLLLVFLTFWILTSYMVPISLFVTIEIVKFWQAFVFVNNDPNMVSPDEPARARNSNLNEDLGKVEYIFSDKTGTLTSNDMQLRMISIKDQVYGQPNFRLEELGPETYGHRALEDFDKRLYKSVKHLQDKAFWKNLMNIGGSREYVLSLPESNPKIRKMRTMDRQVLSKELNEFCTTTPQGVVGKLEVIDESKETNEKPAACLHIMGSDVGDVILGWHIVDFWTNICVCHSLIIEERTDPDDGSVSKVYQGPSPDEVALVEAGRSLGFEFKERTMTGVTLNMQGIEVKFDILNVMEFNSDRKRMSVVARAADGTIRLFCKGADNVMLERLKKDLQPELVETAKQTLYDYSVQGLRTLVLGTKLLDEEEYKLWDQEYQEAAGSLSANRDDMMNRVSEKLEQDFELVGITAIEDKLQDGVPMAIETFRMAGMKVWMITGDKMETAINIGISCRLITKQEDLLILEADHHFEAKQNLERLIEEGKKKKSLGELVELVVDGPSLNHILGRFEEKLAFLGSLCSGVVVCRSSPSQKAAIVNIMKAFELKKAEKGWGGPITRFFRRQNKRIKTKMLSIGDGANDVAMIQAADVGIGIAGKEGRQAVNNSDYAIGQFRFLVRLLLVHGQMSHYRLARLIKFSFFKNISFAFILIYYQFFCGFSGQTLIDDISAAMYNVVFTSMPILLFSLLDRPLDDRILIRFPQIYNSSTSLSTGTFWRTGVFQGLVDAAVCFFIPYFGIAVSASGQYSTHGLWAVGKTIFVSLLGAVTLEAMLVARYWTILFWFFGVMSYVMVYPFMIAFPYASRSANQFDPSQYGVAENVFNTATFWLCIFSVYTLTFGYRYYMRSAKWLFRPDDNMILAEFEQKYGPLHDLKDSEIERLVALDVLDPAVLDARRNGAPANAPSAHLAGDDGRSSSYSSPGSGTPTSGTPLMD